MKATYVVLFAALVSVCAARELQQATTGRVVFFDNPGYSGGGQAFEANVPATGCGDCKDLVRKGFAAVAPSFFTNSVFSLVRVGSDSMTGSGL